MFSLPFLHVRSHQLVLTKTLLKNAKVKTHGHLLRDLKIKVKKRKAQKKLKNRKRWMKLLNELLRPTCRLSIAAIAKSNSVTIDILAKRSETYA